MLTRLSRVGTDFILDQTDKSLQILERRIHTVQQHSAVRSTVTMLNSEGNDCTKQEERTRSVTTVVTENSHAHTQLNGKAAAVQCSVVCSVIERCQLCGIPAARRAISERN